MKIPVVLAEQPLPAGISSDIPGPGGGGPSGLSLAPYRAIEQVGREISRFGEFLGRTMARTEAIKRSEFAKTEAAHALAQFEVDAKTFEQDLGLTERDPDRYLAAYAQGVGERRDRMLQSLRSDEGRALVAQRLPAMLADMQVAAHKRSNQMYTERDAGMRVATLDNLARLAGLTALSDREAFERYRGLGLEVINTSASLSEKDKAEARIAWRDRVLGERGARHAELAPKDFLARVGEYTELGAEKRNALEEKARTRAKQEDEERLKRHDAYLKDLERDLGQEKKDLVTEFERRVREIRTDEDRQVVIHDLNLRQELRQVGAEDYRRLYDAAMNPTTRASDPTVLEMYRLGTAGLRPRFTEEEIRRDPRLSPTDRATLIDTVAAKRKALENEGESDLVRNHNQAEQQLRAALGIRPGIIIEAMGDDPAGRLYYMALDELTRRSRLFGGQEEPLRVMEEMGPRVNQALTQAAKGRLTELKAALRFKTRDELEAARQSLTFAELRFYLRQLSDLERLQEQSGTGGAEGGAGKTPRPRL